LTAVGLYGALAFSVSRRRKEIGVRIALGARSSVVLAMVMREGMIVILFGVAIGSALALAGTRVIRHLLYGSATDDPLAYAAAALVVICLGLVACWIPARRAASVEPVIALREE
jgi:ABC-type antimicrobial peptide transport system permease subunit